MAYNFNFNRKKIAAFNKNIGLDSGETGAITSAKRKERESSDDVPPISLDERLRAITGEAPPEHPSPVESPKAMEPPPEPNQVMLPDFCFQ